MRGDGAGEDVYEDWSSHDERIICDVDGFDFPLPEGSIPGGIFLPEIKSALAQVAPRDIGTSSRKSSSIFFSRANSIIEEDGPRGLLLLVRCIGISPKRLG